MPYNTSSGRMCAVIGCNNCQRKLYRWNEEVCDVHATEKHRDCPCILPFKLHKFPANEHIKRHWVTKLNRKGFEPNSNSVICSIHFLDGKPTTKNPSPQLNLGYESKIQQGRRKLARCSTMRPTKRPRRRHGMDNDTLEKHEKTSIEEPLEVREVFESTLCNFKVQNERKLVHKGVQWEDPSLCDHDYSTGVQVTIEKKKMVDASWQTDSTNVNMLEDNYIPLFTSLTKTLFFSLVASVMQCRSTKQSELPFPDQILLD